ncbi:unnamed protein product [Nezara viridula]|uniref:Uncharacterized protein n=1 Tax=Nezara viridula TaxID=85310 RepID=A0A9P0EBK1_NEZVI|nr:unnamed protein product [Nezara viridula]
MSRCSFFGSYISLRIVVLMTQYEDGDSQLDVKVKKATERISENIHIVANEPSLAFYRLQEHVRKALPPMVEKRVEVTKLHHELQGRCYDVEYAVRTKESTSVYKRLSAHITIDLPDLPELSDALRETASKVESMMAQARTASLATNDGNS